MHRAVTKVFTLIFCKNEFALKFFIDFSGIILFSSSCKTPIVLIIRSNFIFSLSSILINFSQSLSSVASS